eukprot:PhM_4_TR18781/c1_g6_i3/m.21433
MSWAWRGTLPAPEGCSLFGSVWAVLSDSHMPQELLEVLSPVGPDSADRVRFFALRLRAPAVAKDAFSRWVDSLAADTGHTTDLVRLQLLMGCVEWNPGPLSVRPAPTTPPTTVTPVTATTAAPITAAAPTTTTPTSYKSYIPEPMGPTRAHQMGPDGPV